MGWLLKTKAFDGVKINFANGSHSNTFDLEQFVIDWTRCGDY